MELIENDEDLVFLESQRKKERKQPGCMVGVDKVLLQQQKKQNEKKKILQKRLCQPQLDKEQELEQAVLESSSSSRVRRKSV